jgi:hypothetical protein
MSPPEGLILLVIALFPVWDAIWVALNLSAVAALARARDFER